jgi:phenylalanine-4-hydroxylase
MNTPTVMKTGICDDKSIQIELDPKHPGINDCGYIARRNFFYQTCRANRLNGSGMPRFDYSEEERRVWRVVLERLQVAHSESACSIYLMAKAILGINHLDIPDPRSINAKLRELTGFQLSPAEGLLEIVDFFGCLARRGFPCTQYLRHGSDPAFTPEPDMVHDLVGHVPLLVNPGYAAMIELMGRASQEATEAQLADLGRFYWFGIEFGLIQEEGNVKVFGSGLLSSYGEMKHAISNEVEKRPFILDEVLESQYDPTRMQELLFVIPSFEFLQAQLETLALRVGLR